ncbi:MAG: hypothetical protein PS018_08730 [bacterium]|nr:hypothetical protein [bacterium]
MDDVARLRELESDCRRRALSEPGKRWYWLAQAARYQVQADQRDTARFAEDVVIPEIRLAPDRDLRRCNEPSLRRERAVARRSAALLFRRLDVAERVQQRQIVGDLERTADHQRQS